MGSVDHGAPTIQAAAPDSVVSYVPVAKSTRRTLAIGSGRTSRPSFTNRIRRYFASSWREREIFGWHDSRHLAALPGREHRLGQGAGAFASNPLGDSSSDPNFVAPGAVAWLKSPSSLHWISATLQHDLDVVGEFGPQLDAASTAPDTAWIAFLQDVNASGGVTDGTAGYLRASLRESAETAGRPVLLCRIFQAVPSAR